MVSITSLTGSTDGVLFYELASSKFNTVSPRIAKTKTLDGGIFIDHRGVVAGDREFAIQAALDETTALALRDIYENETLVQMSCPTGFFLGAIASLDIDAYPVELTFWVKEDLTV